jgi:8-oxo-dGTP diphosphatase
MTIDETQRPKVGLAAFIWRDGKFIMMQRKGSHGTGTWSVPGGHLEYGETWEECVRREIMEEVGVEVTNIKFLAATNDIFNKDVKHYISIWMTCDWASGEPQNMEPEKITDVEWRSFQDLPAPLFEPCWTNLRQAEPELFS